MSVLGGVLRGCAIGGAAVGAAVAIGSFLGPSPSLMPDPVLTPGVVLTRRASDFCTPGWSAAHRNVSSATRRAVWKAYGYDSPHRGWELDHLIPLEVGGSNARANLWPEPPDPVRGWHVKDNVEDAAHRAVCSGRMSARAAQSAIAKDWVELGRRLGVVPL